MQDSIPSWDEYFLAVAEVVSIRSPDPSTKHGCVLVKGKKIIGTGYNGPPSGMDDSKIPLSRPAKYAWLHHSERNALDNRVIVQDNFDAYITGEPCFSCLISLYSAGVRRIVYGNRGSACIDETDAALKRDFRNWMNGWIEFDQTKNYTVMEFHRS